VHYEYLANNRWRVLKGLRPSLKRVFYPFLSDEEQLAWTTPKRKADDRSDLDAAFFSEARPTKRRAGAPAPRAKTNARYCMSYGTEHGSLVHLQIRRFIESMTHGYRSPLEAREPIDPCTVALLDMMQRERWAPIASELTIFDETARVGTQADLVVYDMARSCVRVVELTFGYEDVDFTHALDDSNRFETPLEMVRNSPAQRKMLQVAMTTEIVRRHYGLRNAQRALVRVCPRSHVVWVYTSVSWWNEPKHVRQAYDHMVRTLSSEGSVG
jgi:hypothetical protein